MLIVAETLDDAMMELYPQLLRDGETVDTSRGPTIELTAVQLEITAPRSRLSRSQMRGRAFSALGELLWYLSGSDRLAFIETYVRRYRCDSEDGQTIHGAYGPRLFHSLGQDQVRNVIELLKARPNTRRAVIQLFAANDLGEAYKEIPCTIALQFILRRGQLQLISTMRSNDAYWGLPHDVFCFTMIQEIVARAVGVEVGSYVHAAGSMHIYEKFRDDARQFVDEGYQERVSMPAMPTSDPWPPIQIVLCAEEKIRSGSVLNANDLGLEPYWADLVRLLQIFHKQGDATVLQSEMSFDRYRPYIQTRTKR
jgi:thymidylate synthase